MQTTNLEGSKFASFPIRELMRFGMSSTHPHLTMLRFGSYSKLFSIHKKLPCKFSPIFPLQCRAIQLICLIYTNVHSHVHYQSNQKEWSLIFSNNDKDFEFMNASLSMEQGSQSI